MSPSLLATICGYLLGSIPPVTLLRVLFLASTRAAGATEKLPRETYIVGREIQSIERPCL